MLRNEHKIRNRYYQQGNLVAKESPYENLLLQFIIWFYRQQLLNEWKEHAHDNLTPESYGSNHISHTIIDQNMPKSSGNHGNWKDDEQAKIKSRY